MSLKHLLLLMGCSTTMQTLRPASFLHMAVLKGVSGDGCPGPKNHCQGWCPGSECSLTCVRSKPLMHLSPEALFPRHMHLEVRGLHARKRVRAPTKSGGIGLIGASNLRLSMIFHGGFGNCSAMRRRMQTQWHFLRRKSCWRSRAVNGQTQSGRPGLRAWALVSGWRRLKMEPRRLKLRRNLVKPFSEPRPSSWGKLKSQKQQKFLSMPMPRVVSRVRPSEQPRRRSRRMTGWLWRQCMWNGRMWTTGLNIMGSQTATKTSTRRPSAPGRLGQTK